MSNTKRTANKPPEPVRIANVVLSELKRELSEDAFKDLKKRLPAYAMRYVAGGGELSVDILKSHIEDGLEDIEKPKQEKDLRTYEGVLGFALEVEEGLDDDHLYFEDMDELFEYYITIGDIENIDRMLPSPFDIEDKRCLDLIGRMCEDGNLDILKYMHQNHRDSLEENLNRGINGAIINGHKKFMEYAIDKLGFDSKSLLKGVWEQNIYYAVKNGSLDSAKYVLEEISDSQKMIEGAMNIAFINGDNIRDIKSCIELGAKPKRKAIYDCLYTNIKKDNLEVTKFILDEFGIGEDINQLRDITKNMTFFTKSSRVFMEDPNNRDIGRINSLSHVHSLLDNCSRGFKDKLHNRFIYLRNSFKAVFSKEYPLLVGSCLDKAGIPKIFWPEKSKKHFNNYSDWRNKIGIEQPYSLIDKSVKLISKGNEFLENSKLFQKEYIGEDTSNCYAYETTVLFKSKEKTLEYLEKWGDPKANQPLHDICYMIEVPQKQGLNLKAWQDAVMQHGPEMAKLVKFADKLSEPSRSVDGSVFSLNKTREEIAKFAFKDGNRHPEFSKEAIKHVWKEEHFNIGLELIKKYTRKYGGEDGRKKLARIPNITLDGSLFDMPDYKFLKLKDGDFRGLSLGEYTDCCQHIANQGKDCAEHGYLSENGGFYVLEDKKGNIIAQTWAWRGEEDELVFDSIESLTDRTQPENWNKICSRFIEEVQKQPNDISAFYVGKGGKTPEISFNLASNPAEPVDYKEYRDSDIQYKIWSKKTGHNI